MNGLGIRSAAPPAFQQAITLNTPAPDKRVNAKPDTYKFALWSAFLELWHKGGKR